MKKLIELDAAIDAVHRSYDTILDFRSDGETVANSVEDILSELPSAQLVAKDINVPVKDCISRQAALDALGEWHDAAITNRINNLPSAQRWIPCSERLPSFDFTDVLVCMHDVRHGCEDEYYIASAYVVRGHWEMTLNVDTSDLEIVAWMPLPEPWKGEYT